VRPDRHTSEEYVAAFVRIARRIADSLQGVAKRALPIKMYVAGGAALHFYTGERISADVDASFSRRIALPEDLEVAFRDADGSSRLLYLDRNSNDTFALMHEDAWDDSRALQLPGIDPAVLDVRLLSPLDLALSKLGRFSSQDRDDIVALGRRGLIAASALRQRAEAALVAYVGDTKRLQGSIDIACRVVADTEKRKPA